MRIPALAVLIVSFSFYQSVARVPVSGDIRTTLSRQVPGYSVQGGNLVEAFTKVASDFKVPVGIEWSVSSATLHGLNFQWNSVDLQEVLDAIVAEYPGYEIEISKDIIHVFPRELRSSRENFLNLRLKKFDIDSLVIELANRRLRSEFNRMIEPPKASIDSNEGEGFSQAATIGDPEIKLKLQNASGREILDELASASDAKIWIVTFIADGGTTSTGFLRTRTIWNNSAIPDSAQPIWDILRWDRENVPIPAILPDTQR
jgi:hypothetical protein